MNKNLKNIQVFYFKIVQCMSMNIGNVLIKVKLEIIFFNIVVNNFPY